ncbi:MAG: hypothetical protein ACTSR8_14125 [Promethearchaeota archaeon]
MSKSVKICSETFLASNRDKLIKTLLNEITFLIDINNKIKDIIHKRAIVRAIEVLENLLKIQGVEADSYISQEDYNDHLRFIFLTMKNVYNALEKEGSQK